MSIEAMKQMIEALENTLGFTGSRQIDSATRQAIQAGRQAIAEAEKRDVSQEPVALMVVNGEISYKSTDDDQSFGMWCPVNYDSSHSFPDGTKFYIHPQPKREPPTTREVKDTLRATGLLTNSQAWDAAEEVMKLLSTHNITSDMKQEHVDKTAKQRHKENT
jgi:hypothetical protein